MLGSVSAFAQFGGGNGTAGNPYQIKTRQHLEALSDSVDKSPSNNATTGYNWSRNKYFKVMNPITDSVRTMIGLNSSSAHRAFQGNFDGQKYKITLAINMPTRQNVGLFSVVAGKKFENIIVDGYVIGSMLVGGIIGEILIENKVPIDTIRINKCINMANITTSSSANITCVGGIVAAVSYLPPMLNSRIVFIDSSSNIGKIVAGGNYEGAGGGIMGSSALTTRIKHCTNIGFITGKTFAGGIAGQFYGEILECNNIGTITGKIVGGMVGYMGDEEYGNGINRITRCINAGLIQYDNGGTSPYGLAVGGIVGVTVTTPNNSISNIIENCLNTGVIEGTKSTNLGGILGKRGNNTTVTNCHYDKQMCIYGSINRAEIAGQAEGHFTINMVGTKLQPKFGTTSWIYFDYLYPMLRSLYFMQ